MMQSTSLKNLHSTLSSKQWKRIGVRRRAGVVAPLFSLYSKDSAGIGDFDDLKILIDWCHEAGLTILQLLPINEMGQLNCPYDSISSFALEPAYISLVRIAGKDKDLLQRVKNIQSRFPTNTSHLDHSIKEEKYKFLRLAFQKRKAHKNGAFKKFREQESYWIDNYALFQVLKDKNAKAAWFEWETQCRQPDSSALKRLYSEYKEEAEFYVWVQWQLYTQLKEVKTHAKKKGILLKGDLPILVSRDSADVWSHQDFFNLDFSSGAPPDMYCAKGQRWGMPPYRWDAIAEDNYRYIKEKLRFAENFYDILRIDHVVGLFRIWAIPYEEPVENQGLNGSFQPPEKEKWGPQGREILKTMLQSTTMLLCAEDLGTIPQICRDTIKEFGVPGNEVQRWAKDWQTRHDFLKADEYRALAVAMLSTHDTTNWAAWWEHEAGTIDEALFIRKCKDRGINHEDAMRALFDLSLSGRGRLRWRKEIGTAEKFVSILGKPKEVLADFIDMYKNTYLEKEKLWKIIGLSGQMREKSDPEIILAVETFNLRSASVFCIELIVDLLSLDSVFDNDPYEYRVNFPGTISEKNWSLRLPVSVEGLVKTGLGKKIKKLVTSASRNP